MNNSWMLAGALLVVAVVPFALLGVVRFVAWAVPPYFRWAAEIERRHYKAYWLVFGAAYVAVGVAHFASQQGEPLFGAVFTGMGLVSIVRGLRGRRTRSVENELTG